MRPDAKEFTRRYQELMDHYGLEMEKINARQAHENGDVEQSHNRFKEAVDQALLLRGSRDFVNRAAYDRFLRDIQTSAMPGAASVLPRKRRAPPAARGTAGELQAVRVRVRSGSTIHVDRNIYSVTVD